eukprot:scaffold32377_cov34-Tisochrysis_lutea.AAC.1
MAPPLALRQGFSVGGGIEIERERERERREAEESAVSAAPLSPLPPLPLPFPLAVARAAAPAMELSPALELLDEWLSSAPYASAFTITAIKATASDLIAQTREQSVEQAGRSAEGGGKTRRAHGRTALSVSPRTLATLPALLELPDIVWRRTTAFFLYGGLYQGATQYYLFNECFPRWFGTSDDLATLATKVLFDQLVLTPFLCLPVAYLIKAIAFAESPAEGLRRYIADVKEDLLIKYWLIWTPAQCFTFGVVPPQYRIAFIALVSFFWLIILSTISARDDAALS